MDKGEFEEEEVLSVSMFNNFTFFSFSRSTVQSLIPGLGLEVNITVKDTV